MWKCRKMTNGKLLSIFPPFCYDLMLSAIWIIFTVLLGSCICSLTKVKALSFLLCLQLFPWAWPPQNRFLKVSLLFINRIYYPPYSMVVSAQQLQSVSLSCKEIPLFNFSSNPAAERVLVPMTVDFMCQLDWPH